MITIFRYNGKIYKPENLERKLKKLRITLQDIEILGGDTQKQNTTQDTTPEWKQEGKVKYRWVNKNSNSNEYNYSIIGIHNPDILPNKPKHLMNNPNDWEYEDIIK